MHHRRDLAVAAATALLLAGCGANTTRLDRAGSVASAGSSAVAASQSFLKNVRAARDEANATLVAANPSCAWTDSIVISGLDRYPLPGTRNPRPIPFCQSKKDAAKGDFDYSLKPIPDAALRPTLQSIEALAAYLDAVNTILGDEKPDYAAKAGDALATVQTALDGINALAGGDVVPGLTGDQKSALASLGALALAIADEHRKVAELRTMVRNDNGAALAVIDRLRGQIANWGNNSLVGDFEKIDSILGLDGYRLGENPPLASDYDARRKIIARVQASGRDVAAAARLTRSVAAALDAVAEAQTQFIKGLGDHPDWTKAEVARQAQINRSRLIGAFKALAAAVSAF